MAKVKTQFVCQQCGRVTLRQMGRCPQCGTYNSMVEQIVAEPRKGDDRRPVGAVTSAPKRLRQIEGDVEARLPLPLEEFARVLGGGIVPGSLVLVGGDPGIGKSTLLAQMAMLIADESGPVLYVSGEESERQIKMRALRLTQNGEPRDANTLPENLFLVNETNLDLILEHIQSVKPRVVVIDSIQTAYLQGLTSAAGSVSQVRECAARLQGLATSTMPVPRISNTPTSEVAPNRFLTPRSRRYD